MVVATIIAIAIAGVLRGSGASVREMAGKLDLRWLSAAASLTIIYRICNAAGWGMILRALGHPLPLKTSVRLWLVAETMRWLPGSVWGFVSRVYQAQKAGVPAAAASVSMPLELAVTVVAWGLAALCGGASMGRIAAGWSIPMSPLSAYAPGAGLLLSGIAGAVALWRFPGAKISRKALGFLGGLKRAFRARPRPLMLLAALAWFAALCFLNGLTFYALLRAFDPPTMPSLEAAVGINAIGWLVGFFAVFSPGGLGVREGGMTALLAPLVPLPVAVGSVVLWRVVQIMAEVLCLGACYLPAAAILGRRGVRVAVNTPPWSPIRIATVRKGS